LTSSLLSLILASASAQFLGVPENFTLVLNYGDDYSGQWALYANDTSIVEGVSIFDVEYNLAYW
jgi:hypothetical protein